MREFGATTTDLPMLTDYLKDGSYEMTAMESTASYWKLLQPNYIPDTNQRKLMELVRYHKSLAGEQACALNQLQKILKGANLKLSGTVSDINRKSACSILEYLFKGESIDDAKYDEINNFMKPEEKKASATIQDVTVIGNPSARAIISVIGTDTERFSTDSLIFS